MSNPLSKFGNGTRQTADGNPDHLDAIRKPFGGLFHRTSYGKRWCETCKTFQQPDKTKAVKGWRCAGCKAKP